jgi:hypothetical protein
LKWEDVPTTTTVYNWSVNTSYEAPTWSWTSYTYPNGRIGGDYPAFLHCSGLWTWRRLPTRNELATLVDYSRTTVSGKYYRNIWMVDGTYLASTLYNNTNPRSVNFSTALINGLTNKTTTAYVICIKD